MGRYWRTRTPHRLQSLIFQATVFSSALTGLEAFYWPKSDSDAIDKVVLALARKASGIRAFDQKRFLQSGEHRAISTEAVRKLWRLPWHFDELRARRLWWYQSMSRDLGSHVQALAALFGTLPVDTRRQQVVDMAPILRLPEMTPAREGTRRRHLVLPSRRANSVPPSFFGDMTDLSLMNSSSMDNPELEDTMCEDE